MSLSKENSFATFSLNSNWTSCDPKISKNHNGTLSVVTPKMTLIDGNIKQNQMQQKPENEQNEQFPFQHVSKPFSSSPKVTTTLVPLNVGPKESCNPVPLLAGDSANVERSLIVRGKRSIKKHYIENWLIVESSEPFHEAQSDIFLQKNQKLSEIDLKKLCQTLPDKVHNWTIDDVCIFVERVLDKSCYTAIVKEHLIDGIALLLIEDEHLKSTFKMPLGPRLKLINRINQLKSIQHVK